MASKRPAQVDLDQFFASAAPAAAPADEVDQYFDAPAAEAPKAPEPSIVDKVKTRLGRAFSASASAGGPFTPLGIAKGAGELIGGEGGGDAVERGLLKSAPVVGPLAEEIAGGVNAGKAALTGGDPLTAYREGRNAEQDKTDKAAHDHGLLFGGTQIAAAIATPAAGTTALGKLGFGLGEAALSSAADSRGDLTEGGFTKVARDVGLGLGLTAAFHGAGAGIRAVKGAASGAAKDKAARLAAGVESDADLKPLRAPGTVRETNVPFTPPQEGQSPQQALDKWAGDVSEAKKTARVLPGKAEQTYRDQVLDTIAAGSTPTERTRAWKAESARNNALALVEENSDLKKAVNAKDQERIRDTAERLADDASRKTQPAYDAMDKDGLVPIEELKTRVRREIAGIQTPARRNEAARIPTLEKLEADLDTYAMKHGGDSIPHRKLRDLATSFLKEKNQVVGSIAETPNYTFRKDNHELVDGYLNDRLNQWAAAKPENVKVVEDLRQANRQIASALGIAGVADNAINNVGRKVKTRADQVVEKTRQIGKDFDGGIAVGTARSIKRAVSGDSEELARQYTEDQVRKFGELAYAIRKGRRPDIEKAAQDLEASGVPQKVVRIFLGEKAPQAANNRAPVP